MPEWLKHPDAKALVTPADPNQPYGDPAPTPAVSAGRDLDALVAEKVLGWTPDGRFKYYNEPRFIASDGLPAHSHEKIVRCRAPQFSTDIAAAWPVLDWIRSQRDSVFVAFDTRDNRWEVEACDHVDYDTGKRDDGSNPRGCAVCSSGDTAPLAICKAALSLASTNRAPSPHTP